MGNWIPSDPIFVFTRAGIARDEVQSTGPRLGSDSLALLLQL